MSEQGQDKDALPPTDYECIGPVSFNGRVFHGTNRAVPVDLSVDYTELYIKDNPHEIVHEIEGSTLGAGLYTTVEEEAIAYAQKRERGGLPGEVYVQEIDISGARLYDFRQRSNPRYNGRVSVSVGETWQAYYEVHKAEIVEWMRRGRPEGVEDTTRDLKGYSDFLNFFVERLKTGQELHGRERRGLDLRDMLRTYLTDPDATSTLHGGLWTRFALKELECDGLIYNEGGERGFQTPKGAPSYVLYNLSKITSQNIKII